jgi:hypothetical protein
VDQQNVPSSLKGSCWDAQHIVSIFSFWTVMQHWFDAAVPRYCSTLKESVHMKHMKTVIVKIQDFEKIHKWKQEKSVFHLWWISIDSIQATDPLMY